MSTEKNPHADETATQSMDAVDETQEITVVETEPVVEPIAEVEPIVEDAPVVENTPAVDDAPTLEHEPPTRGDTADPFDLYPAAPTEPYAAQPVSVPTPILEPAATEPVTEAAPRRLRVGTVVWGLILAACGLGVVAWASGARIDFQLALIVLLAVAGTALLVGSILSGARHARR